MMRPVAEIPDARVVTSLGRGVIVGPGAAAPAHWAGADRVVLDDAALREPGEALEALHRHWSQRIPVVVELQCAVDELRAPDTEHAPPHALSPHFELTRERLYFLVRANNYDDRAGRTLWGPAVEAQRLGATPSETADVIAEGAPAWCDGGPRAGATAVPDGHVLVGGSQGAIADSVGGGAPSRSRLQDSTRMPPASTYSIAMTPSADRLSSLPWP